MGPNRLHRRLGKLPIVLLLFLVPRIPQVETEHLVVRIVKELWIDPTVEATLRYALHELASFSVDDQAVIGRVQNVIAANRDLGVHLSIAIIRSIKDQHAILSAGISALLSFAARSVLVERFMVDWLDNFYSSWT